MRRSLCFTMLLGILFAVLTPGPAGADGSCDGDFSARLACWSRRLGGGTVTVTVDRVVSLDGSAKDRRAAVRSAVRDRGNLEVLVPTGVSTGEGGTVLLVLAGRRVVDPDARIDRLSHGTVTELERAGACSRAYKDLCDVVGPAAGKPAQVPGSRLITTEQVTGRYMYAVTPADRGTGAKTWLLYGMSALLVILLTALVLAVRRSRAPRPALAASRSVPRGVAPDPAAEPTTHLRTVPAPAQSRGPAARNGPTRPAVVRTDLHPQGYVEIGRVLRRAVWAQPGQAPPGPGARVDVTGGPDRDADLLYAFPPATGRQTHAR